MKIHIFVMNITFISSREVKKYFFNSLDERKVILNFMTKNEYPLFNGSEVLVENSVKVSRTAVISEAKISLH